MPRYRIITLVDITRTDAGRSDPSQIRICQQSNFNSLRQSIEMRSNVFWVADPKKHTGRLPNPLDGKATHWIWDFEVEREDVFLKDSDPVGLLKDDLHGVPIIPNLENDTELDPPAIQTKNGHVNTWVAII